MRVHGMDDILEEVVDAFVKEYPFAGDRLEFDKGTPKPRVLGYRMLLKAFNDGYNVGVESPMQLDRELERVMDALEVVIHKFEDPGEAVDRIYDWLDVTRVRRQKDERI
jgi:hypothetical protein